MKQHLIIGFGQWSKKIINFLQKKNLYSKIYVKKRQYYFQYGKKEKITDKNFSKIKKNIDSIHICTPLDSHYNYLKKNIKIRKIIVEKPFLESVNQINKIQNINLNNNLIIVNYTYLFYPFINNLKKNLTSKENKKIIINFSKKNNFYRRKNDCLNDWLDHPLSIILYSFKSFSKFKIVEKTFIKKKKGTYEKLILNYYYDKLIVQIRINNLRINKKNILIYGNAKKTIYDFKTNSVLMGKKKIIKYKKTSFEHLYFTLKNHKRLSFQNYNFHKLIVKERKKILKEICNV